MCGQAGMGIQTVESLLAGIFKLSGYNVFSTREYMSRVRGGSNSTEIRVSSKAVRAAVNRIDILIAFDKSAIGHVGGRISAQTIILADKEVVADPANQAPGEFVDVPLNRIAVEIGNRVYSNIVAVGAIAGLFGIDLDLISKYVERFFSSKSSEVVRNNLEAVKRGFEFGKDLRNSAENKISIGKSEVIKDEILLSGTEAVSMGAIAGGCNFISSYPMSPATGVLAFLAKHGREFGIIAEQAEDEIAAINMAIGAWYGSTRAMVSTSGGGFALMTEGISLSAMLEMPIVVHLGQRPGPATGLPTRSEQGDLELVLYGGHGEFPRIILAPGDINEAFYLMQKAFNLADRYQVPVFVLTDQYLLNSTYNTASFDLSQIEIEKHIVKTSEDYRRYELTDSGISPRGVPGFGDGLVSVDSDEHDQEGHITEDLELRIKMVDKRLKKTESMKDQTIEPELVGPEDYKVLVVCWGSTRNVVQEAVNNLRGGKVSFLHFKQVYPLPERTAEYLKKAAKIIITENNATCQFGKLIKLNTGIDIEQKILKYDGMGFFVEEVTEKLASLIN
ncbi:MAG: 2-oxoacid:acceptor oxidoreductase subunit alpha [Planctomycetota bacterium]